MNSIVEIKSNNIVADSLTIAKHFGKEHKHVLDSIVKLIEDIKESDEDLGQPKIRLSYYTNSQNKQHPKYYLDRDSFSLLVMGFTGKKSFNWKLKYIKAFNKMEAIVQQQSNSEWLLERSNGKLIRRNETDVIQLLVDYATEQGSTKPTMYYMLYSKLANSVVGVSAGMRDELDDIKLSELKIVERKISELILSKMSESMFYKDIFTYVTDEMSIFKSLFKPQLQIKEL